MNFCRKKLLDVPPEKKEYRFNGKGYVAVDWKDSIKKQTNIQMFFKTDEEDGLLFTAYSSKNTAKRETSDSHKISIEMRGGRVLFQVRF